MQTHAKQRSRFQALS